MQWTRMVSVTHECDTNGECDTYGMVSVTRECDTHGMVSVTRMVW